MSKLFIFLLKSLRFVVFFASDLVLKFVFPKMNYDSSKIVLIRMDAIGDFIIWLDSAKAFANKYGQENITLIVNSVNLEIAEKLPFWKTIIPVSPKKFRSNFLYRYKIIKKLRTVSCEKAVNTTYSRSFWTDDSVSRFVNAKNKIAVAGDNSNNSTLKNMISDRFYSEIISVDNNIKSEFKRNSEILNKLSFKHSSSIFVFPESFFESISEFNLPEKYFVMFPGSSNYKKEWPKENFVVTAKFINEKFGLKCVICGGNDNAEVNDYIFEQIKAFSVNTTGKSSLVQLASIIKHAEFVLSNDTSAVHTAASSRTKSFCITGGGHFGRFLPYDTDNMQDTGFYPMIFYSQMQCFNCNWNCIFKKEQKYPCVSNIDTAKVCDAIGKSFINT